MSHVIPLWLVQTLNLYRWNCNVFGLSRKMTGLNYVRNLAGGFLDDACRRRSQALRTVGRAPIGGFFRLKYRSGSPTTSHVIPLWLVQTLNLYRWNCNVFGLSRKMTGLNYVRNLAGGFLDDACRRRSQALRTVGRAPIGGFFRLKYRSGSPTTSHVIPLWLVQTLNLYRWNCNVFGLSRKMTGLNYVRNLAGGFLDDACRRRSQALRSVGRCVRLVVARWKMHFA